MSRDERYVVVPNWDKFQHYSGRNPPWIKIYTHLNSHDDWRSLTDAQRGVLITIWLEYARSYGVLTVRHLGGQLHVNSVRYGHLNSHLDSLVQAGFIQLTASKPASTRALAREEKKKEETPLPPFKEKVQKPEWRPNEPTRTNVQARDPVAAIQALIRNGVIRDQVDLAAELAGYALEPNLADELRAMLELQSVSNLLESEQT